MARAAVTAKNIKGIEYLQLPTPECGIVVLTGDNGIGKTTMLEAIDYLLSGRGDLDLRDRETEGSLEGFGRVVNIKGGRKQNNGRTNVKTLDAKFALTDFVDPKNKDPLVADAKRLKVALQTAGVKADETAQASFYDILGDKEEFEKVVSRATRGIPDLVDFAAAAKRDIERKSRELKEQALADRAKADGLDVGCQVFEKPAKSVEALEADWKEASAESRKLSIQKSEIEKVRESLTAQQLLLLKSADPATELDQAQKVRATAINEAHESQQELDAALAKLADAKSRKLLEDAGALASANDVGILTKKVAEFELLKKQSEQAMPEPISLVIVEAAEEFARDISEQLQAAKEWDKIAAIRQHASDLRDASVMNESMSEILRNSAGEVDAVLTSFLVKASPRLFWENGRMLIEDSRRGKCPFGEQSAGQRWDVAFDLSIDALGDGGGVFVIPQEAWEGLSPSKKKRAAQRAVEANVLCYTGEATDGEELSAYVVGDDAQELEAVISEESE